MRYLYILATVLAAFAASISASAQNVESFYKGKQIGFYIGFNSGETYDLYARLEANYLGRYIPGEPIIVPYNMPGIGGLKVANFLANQAPRDGAAIGMSTQSLVLEQALSNPAVHYDARTLGWIGRMAPIQQFIVVSSKTGVKNFEDVRQRETLLAATSPSGMTYVIPQVLNRLAGSRFKIIPGYSGTSGALLAFERGEVEAVMMTFTNMFVDKKDWLKSGKVIPLVSNLDVRTKSLPNVPSMVEVGITPENRQILNLYSSPATFGRAIAAPPGVPAERLQALRHAFDMMVKDPGFQEDPKKRKLLEFEALPGSQLQSSVAKTLALPPAVLKRAAEARK
jgi:tripartite-type tricarboxylate transporter receptor subunit TctC